jgi:hypothetical protein
MLGRVLLEQPEIPMKADARENLKTSLLDVFMKNFS